MVLEKNFEKLFPQDAEENEYRFINAPWLDEIAIGLTAGGGEASGGDMEDYPYG